MIASSTRCAPDAIGGSVLTLVVVAAGLFGRVRTANRSWAVRVQRVDYNAALQETSDQQILLNIVKLRYSQTPSFLEVTGRVTQLRLEVGGQAEATAGAAPGLTAGATVVYADHPTITYLPSQGELRNALHFAPVMGGALGVSIATALSVVSVAKLATLDAIRSASGAA